MNENIMSLSKTQRAICWRMTDDDDVAAITELIATEFCYQEPVWAALKLSEDDISSYIEFVKNHILIRPSLCAYDKESGEICGVCIVYGPECKVPTEDRNWTEKVSQYHMFNKTEFSGEIKAYAGNEPYINGTVMCVRKKYQKMGIAQALYRKRMELSRQDGRRFYFIIATSVFTTKALINLGAEVIKESSYADYEDPTSGKKILADFPPPHSSAKLLVLDLQSSQNTTTL